jgi:hypothetical protein
MQLVGCDRIHEELPARSWWAVTAIFDLFNAAWCVWTPQPRGTQLQLRCSVVGPLPLRALLAASTAFERRQSRLGPLSPVRFLFPALSRLGLAFCLLVV